MKDIAPNETETNAVHFCKSISNILITIFRILRNRADPNSPITERESMDTVATK